MAKQLSLKSEEDRIQRRRKEFARLWEQVVPSGSVAISPQEAGRVITKRAKAEDAYVKGEVDTANDILEEEAMLKITREGEADKAKARSLSAIASESMASDRLLGIAAVRAQEQAEDRRSYFPAEPLQTGRTPGAVL